jgi:hypothetical protein
MNVCSPKKILYSMDQKKIFIYNTGHMPAQKGIENTAWRPYWMLDLQQKII